MGLGGGDSGHAILREDLPRKDQRGGARVRPGGVHSSSSRQGVHISSSRSGVAQVHQQQRFMTGGAQVYQKQQKWGCTSVPAAAVRQLPWVPLDGVFVLAARLLASNLAAFQHSCWV
jgi:hypothetical protein